MEQANDYLLAQLAFKSFQAEFVEPPTTPSSDIALPVTIRPNFRLFWGDGPRDQIETDDSEALILEASNPYTNVIIKDLVIVSIELMIGDALPPTLPDDSPSVTLTPCKMISFGDLYAHSNLSLPAARELFLLSRGARPGNYTVRLHYQFSVELQQNNTQSFKLELVRS